LLKVILVFVASATGSLSVSAAGPDAKDIEFFEAKIRPVLAKHCYECHSAAAAAKGKLKAQLALDTRAGIQKGGESGKLVVAGKPNESSLLKALRHDADASAMPPNEKLPAAVVADFETWILRGAPDPRDGAAVSVKRGMSIEEGRKFWSFVPPQAVPPPAVKDVAWAHDDVDQFLRAKQEEIGLRPLGNTEPTLLLRRLSFDLIGLPPSPAEVTDFSTRWTSSTAAAQEALLAETVDRLLASPHFGERWGRHWLDVARYADSNGRDRNVINYHAWRYRDYVIASFNNDKPFDRFIREQIAGDLVPADSREQRDEQLIATGFLALGSKAFEELKPEIFRMDVIDEQIEVVGRAILGMSIGCARCHDHKFDPIPTADYYALAGIFRSTQPLYGYGPKGIKATAFHHTELVTVGPDAEANARVGLALLKKLNELQATQNQASVDRYRVVRNLSAVRIEREKADNKSEVDARIAEMEAEIKDWDIKVKAHKEELQAAMDNGPRHFSFAMGVRESDQPEDCRIHIRGETTNLADVVPRGMLQVMSSSSTPVIRSGQSGRLDLAEWLTHRDNPLTARVIVNRVWLHLFGRGLVTTPDDYGVNGARPSHPQLLDFLAVKFMDEGWSTKKLIRLLVLSRAYRMASTPAEANQNLFAAQLEKDPENIYLWRMQPRRLEIEPLRDAILDVAGTLDRTPPPADKTFLSRFNPYREDEYRTHQPAFGPTSMEQPYRSVYLPVIRGVLPEMFQLFDFASPERSVPQRNETIVPAQALFFMNSPWVIEQARATAKRLLADTAADDPTRVARLYEAAFARRPTDTEAARAIAYLSVPESLKPDPKAKNIPIPEELREERWTSFCQTVFASAEFRYLR
jgi:hypothetical protein